MNINSLLEKYGRFGLDATTAATTVSFAAAKAATKMGVCQLFPHLLPRFLTPPLCTGLRRSQCSFLGGRPHRVCS